MIQDVKLGTHKIGTLYVCHQQVCVLARLLFGNAATKRSFIRIKSYIVGVERDVATRMAQVVWPMMTVTPRASAILQIIIRFRPKLLPSEALKICHSSYHHRPHHLSHSCGHTPFHTHIN